ncbi:MAG: sugar ABC transporter substrate-binding protein [Desulfosarcinaceae bacterium]|jgi:fructose transport system substrate-binding protein
MKRAFKIAGCLLLVGLMAATANASEKIIVGLITKTNTNPFFVEMRKGALEKAKELGIELRTFAGKYDGDVDTQVQAVENLIAAGAKGILITPNDSKALVPVIQEARKAGLVVIALDTPLDPPSAADATFATDNFEAGLLIGKWARAKLGSKDPKIAMLDLNISEISVDVGRDQGFLKGFGIDIKDPNDIGDEKDPRIVGHDVTKGAEEGGRTAMENLLQKDPGINLVYTINEPAAAGAFEALKAAGREKDVLIVSVDGGCAGVKNIDAGIIGATSMQFPLRMASYGVEAIVKYAQTGVKPGATPGLEFYNTGVQLITNQQVPGVTSISAQEGLDLCWGN